MTEPYSILALLVSVYARCTAPADVARLQSTAPHDLTEQRAREHLVAATIAASVYDVDPAILLSIGHHESRYQHGVTYREASGHDSCGVMQVTVRTRAECTQLRSSAIAGYLAGARVLRNWLDACRGNEWCALTGYAGGFYLIDYCRRQRHPNCGIPWEFQERARRIRQ